MCKLISVLSFAQTEQFHVPKFVLSESKIMKNIWGREKNGFFLWETHYILGFTMQDKYNLKEFIEVNKP